MLLLQAVYQQVNYKQYIPLVFNCQWQHIEGDFLPQYAPQLLLSTYLLICYLRYGAVFSGNKLSILTPWIKTCDFLSAQKFVESLTIVPVNQLEVQKVDVHPVDDSKQRWWVPVWLFTSMTSPLENGPHRLRRRRMSDIFHPLVENHEEHEWVDVCVFLLNSQDVPQPIGRWKEDFLLL